MNEKIKKHLINDCQLNEMFENYADYAESVKDNINEDTVDAFQMSAALAILLKSDKMTIMEKYINWYNTYKM